MRKRDELTRGCMAKAGDDEMTFVLLSRDKAAPRAIRMWASERVQMALNQPDDPQITEALECARVMDPGRRRRDPRGGAPDDRPHRKAEGRHGLNVLWDEGGRYRVVDAGLPGLRLYDTIADDLAPTSRFGAFYDDPRHGTALEWATEAAKRANADAEAGRLETERRVAEWRAGREQRERDALAALPGIERYPCGTKWLAYWAAHAGQSPADYLREYLAEVDAERRSQGETNQ